MPVTWWPATLLVLVRVQDAALCCDALWCAVMGDDGRSCAVLCCDVLWHAVPALLDQPDACATSSLFHLVLLTTTTTPAEIDLSVFFSTQHGGRHVFRLCTQPNVDNACLDSHTLQRWVSSTGWMEQKLRLRPKACCRRSDSALALHDGKQLLVLLHRWGSKQLLLPAVLACRPIS
jgi:hypothetical protein